MHTRPWSDFEPVGSNKWLDAARQELQGEDPFEKLAITKEKIKIVPYYDKSSRSSEVFFSVPPSNLPHAENRAWQNMPKVTVASEKEANQQALEHLNHGAEGVVFDLDGRPVNVPELLQGIQLPYCTTAFSGNWPSSFPAAFISYASGRFGTAPLPGFFLAQPLGETLDFAIGKLNSFRPLSILLDNRTSAAESIAKALDQLVSTVDRLTDQGHPAETVFQQVVFGVSVGTDFFLDVALIKTLRCLAQLVARAYGVSDGPYLHVTSAAWFKETLQPHGNLLKSTTAGLAAVLGGCDSLTIEPETQNELMSRMARNLSLLLREESHLTRVADPLAGSYYLDSLTHELMNKSWQRFLLANR